MYDGLTDRLTGYLARRSEKTPPFIPVGLQESELASLVVQLTTARLLVQQSQLSVHLPGNTAELHYRINARADEVLTPLLTSVDLPHRDVLECAISIARGLRRHDYANALIAQRQSCNATALPPLFRAIKVLQSGVVEKS
jgi:hypothetical protein